MAPFFLVLLVGFPSCCPLRWGDGEGRRTNERRKGAKERPWAFFFTRVCVVSVEKHGNVNGGKGRGKTRPSKRRSALRANGPDEGKFGTTQSTSRQNERKKKRMNQAKNKKRTQDEKRRKRA